jgi:hypothetical protein
MECFIMLLSAIPDDLAEEVAMVTASLFDAKNTSDGALDIA